MKKLLLLLATFIFIGLSVKAQIDLTQGLVAYYPFNGNAHDERGNRNPGSIFSQIPTLTIDTIFDISFFQAKSRSTISSNGGAEITSGGVCWSIYHNPDITNNKTVGGRVPGSFVSEIKGLTSNTNYYVRAYAINEAGISYSNELSFTTATLPDIIYGSVTDIEGNKYKTVEIGNQTWMAENLRTTSYNDGTSLPNVTGNIDWATLNSGAYCYFSNDTAKKSTLGALYNSYAVRDTRKLCPTGWHISTKAEWDMLPCTNSVYPCPELKDLSWRGDNSSGFSALQSGVRQGLQYPGYHDGTEYNGMEPFGEFKVAGSFYWTSDGSFHFLNFNDYVSWHEWQFKPSLQDGYSIRCVADTNVPESDISNLALNKPVTQSSTKFHGVAERAVDGNTDGIWNNGSVSHTGSDFNPWLEIDLGGIYNINTIRLWNRTDNCCMSRLSDFYVFASDEPFVSKKLQNTLNQPGIWHIHESGFPNPADTFRVDRTGRYIRIQLNHTAELNIAEVKVFGSLNPVLSNIALNKPVTQSSNLYGGVPERAVDGNTNGLWSNRSVTHTQRDKNAWWELDLGGVYEVESIELWNRTDNCCRSRLSDYYVLASEVPFGSKELNATLNQSDIWFDHQNEYPDPVIFFDINRSIRYVRVQSAGFTELNIAEVKVLGATSENNLKSIGDEPDPVKTGFPEISIYPVPFRDIVHIESDQIIENIQFYSVLGELLITDKCLNTSADINTGFLSPGFYVVRIKTASGDTKTYSLIKSKE